MPLTRQYRFYTISSTLGRTGPKDFVATIRDRDLAVQLQSQLSIQNSADVAASRGPFRMYHIDPTVWEWTNGLWKQAGPVVVARL